MYREWISHCSTGSFQACFSLQLSFVHNFSVTTGTYTTNVAIRVANLQGRAQWLPNPGPYAISFLDLHGLQTDWPGNPGGSSAVALGGGATVTPGALGFGGIRPEYFGIGGTDFLEAMDANLIESDVIGCTVDPQHTGRGAFQTCDGWVDLTFTLPGTWSFTDATTVSLSGRMPDTSVWACDDLDTCSMQVTPEPVTLLLLGTGLTGLGAVALRRRRRRDGP